MQSLVWGPRDGRLSSCGISAGGTLTVDKTALVLERIEPWWSFQGVHPAKVELFELRQRCEGIGKCFEGIAPKIELAKLMQVADG